VPHADLGWVTRAVERLKKGGYATGNRSPVIREALVLLRDKIDTISEAELGQWFLQRQVRRSQRK
jgi:hypothetical protein